ncbi:MAG TPA: hypothetical protein DGT23_34420, partial [Micromonosporaceae bacterium]|nr:hypothetical protein [Micromonosporaceae bacterium]
MSGRVRVLVFVGALAVAGLAGCRSEPGVAAYVGDTTITEDRVTQVYDDAQAKLDEAVRRRADEQAAAAGQPAPTALPEVKLPITRKDVLSALV